MLTLIGCDFTSRPTPQKPITLAIATTSFKKKSAPKELDTIEIQSIHGFDNFVDFQRILGSSDELLKAPWIGGFDLPFGLPRDLVRALGWPLQWEQCLKLFCTLERARIRDLFKGFCDQRPLGFKFAHRATDYVANSSPSMKWVNPPVAFMLHAGIPLLIGADLTLPGVRTGDPSRIGLEAYPGMLAREMIGNQSYKSDDKHKQNDERHLARQNILDALQAGTNSLGVKVKAHKNLLDQMVQDASGDSLDAVLCATQAAWGAKQFHLGDPLYGLASDMDPLEGWILTC